MAANAGGAWRSWSPWLAWTVSRLKTPCGGRPAAESELESRDLGPQAQLDTDLPGPSAGHSPEPPDLCGWALRAVGMWEAPTLVAGPVLDLGEHVSPLPWEHSSTRVCPVPGGRGHAVCPQRTAWAGATPGCLRPSSFLAPNRRPDMPLRGGWSVCGEGCCGWGRGNNCKKC